MLIEDRQVSGPATHVLAIGCGAYPYLAGPAPIFPLRPLQSPKSSAEAFAEFFQHEHRSSSAPLGTIDLLASHPSDPSANTCDLKRIKAAVGAWFTRCDAHPDNVAVFYFCGHGFERGFELALLADDFGSSLPPSNPMDEAVDLNALVAAMARCRAGRQCFFIDCCRELPESQVDTLGSFGAALLQGSSRPPNPARDYATYYAAGATGKAWGASGKPSRFTQALLRSLKGAGADEENGAWRVDTASLHRGIFAIFEIENRRPNMPPQRPRLGGNTAGFVLHELGGPPEVPVLIGCDPSQRNALATFKLVSPAGHTWSRVQQLEDWELDLRVSSSHYDLEVTVPSHPGPIHRPVPIWPPSRICRPKVP